MHHHRTKRRTETTQRHLRPEQHKANETPTRSTRRRNQEEKERVIHHRGLAWLRHRRQEVNQTHDDSSDDDRRAAINKEPSIKHTEQKRSWRRSSSEFMPVPMNHHNCMVWCDNDAATQRARQAKPCKEECKSDASSLKRDKDNTTALAAVFEVNSQFVAVNVPSL